jgi:sorting nexin-29
MENSQCYIKLQSELSRPLNIKNGLRQGDALACVLFNIALEKVIRDSGIQMRGTIIYRSLQLLAYSDDIDIIARSEAKLIKTYTVLKISAEKMGLKVNEEKTKYMMISDNKRNLITKQDLNIYGQKFERVNRFIYLGSLVNDNNNVSEEIKKRIQNANKCYYGLRNNLDHGCSPEKLKSKYT